VSSIRKFLPAPIAGSILLSFGLLVKPTPVQAEGSRNLYPAGSPGSRANLEWRNPTDFYGNQFLYRRTILQVFARQGEAILLGSSAVGINGPAGGTGDILVYNPGSVPDIRPLAIGIGREPATFPAPSFSCLAQRTINPALGLIDTRDEELAGPNTITDPATGAVGAVPNAYPPCFYVAPATGIYTVIVTGPAGLNPTQTGGAAEGPNPTGIIGGPGTAIDTGNQNTNVAAWDITVRSSLTSTTDLPGRLFSYYLTLFAGGFGRPVESEVFIQTNDGYLYSTDLKGIQPNGFLLFGNRLGNVFRSNIGLPIEQERSIFRNLVDQQISPSPLSDQLNDPAAGVALTYPEFPIFFNRPDPQVLSALGVPGTPVAPAVEQGSLSFSGAAGSNNTFVSTGGTFTYRANVPHVYELVISRDGTNFDPANPQNATLSGANSTGSATVQWNGLDNTGTPFPVGNNYQVRLSIRGGSYHFPLLDVEEAPNGTPSLIMLNPPGPDCFVFGGVCSGGFYDDRGYQTPVGTVGTVNQPLAGAPDPAVALLPFDSRSAQRSFTNSFGDKKGLDLWTYYPSQASLTALNIIAESVDLEVQKIVDNPATTIGGNATFTIVASNNGPGNATDAQVTDLIPPGLTFVSATPSQGTYDPATGIWNIGNLAVNATATLQIVVTVNTSDRVTNVATIAGAQPDPQPDNNQSEDSLNIPNFRIVKRITAATRSGVPVTFSGFVDDPSDPNDTVPGWGQFPLIGVVNVPASEPFRSGDEVEYTIYFLSDGVGPVLGANICDQIDPRTQLVDNTGQIRQVTGQILPGGSLLQPLAPLPIGNSCENQSNPNGSAVFDLGNVPSTPGSNAGFIRFRVRLN
jgi:uncharacterized repeat protein (TIGR01451 family)